MTFAYANRYLEPASRVIVPRAHKNDLYHVPGLRLLKDFRAIKELLHRHSVVFGTPGSIDANVATREGADYMLVTATFAKF